jgi:hypothetical protein
LMDWQPRTQGQAVGEAPIASDPLAATSRFLYRCADFR